MLTGQLARGLGLGQAPKETPLSAAPVVKDQSDRLVAEVLRQSGYETRGMTANGWVGTHAGFNTGFEQFVDLVSDRQGQLGGGLKHRLRWAWDSVGAQADDGAARAGSLFKRWIAEVGPRPFFWFVNLVECHSPYLPPKPYTVRSPLTRVLAADEAFRHLTFEAFFLSGLGKRTAPPRAIKRMRTLYRASLRYVDACLGDLFESMGAAGILDETLVIVCSDHGENFGVGGLMGHGLSLDDRLLHVPFIVAGPGASAFEGMRSLVEVPSRIARAVGLTEHPWDTGMFAGLPVAQWDTFELTDDRRDALREQYELDDEQMARLRTPLTCAVADRLKLVRGADPEDESLFDLDADQLELAPLRGTELKERAGDALPALRAAVNHPLVQAKPDHVEAGEEVPPEELDELERRMRLMGYL
jgi:arylsulfatase A-like enzyme